MKRVLAWIAFAIATSGCIHVSHRHDPARAFAVAPSSTARCTTLDSRVLGLHLTGLIAGVLGGGSTAAAGVLKGNANDVPLYWSAVGGAILFSVVGTVSSTLSTYEASQFTKENCK